MCALKYIKSNMSIQHLDDLPATEFVNVISNFSNFTGSIKQDGANLWFGMDGEQLYVSREGKSKSAKPMYAPGDFEDIAANDQFKAALIALQTVKSKIAAIIKEGENIEIEVIFGSQPNVVKYHDDDNHATIMFLRSIGTPSKDTITRLSNALRGHTVDVELPVKNSADGISITDESKTVNFKFQSVEHFKLPDIKNSQQVTSAVQELQAFMVQPSEVSGTTNAELEVTKTSDENKRAKINCIVKMNELKGAVKNAIMVAMSDDGSLNKEGYVISSKTDDKIYKLVNKHHFTKINEFFQKGRKTAIGVIMTTEPTADLQKRGGIVGIVKIKISTILGRPDFARAQTVKKSLSELGTQDFLKQFNISDLEATKIKINRAIDDGVKLLNVELSRLKNTKGGSIEISGESVSYSDSVMSRTKIAFAEAFADLKKLKNAIVKSTSIEELISAVYGRFIDLNTGIAEGKIKMISYTLLEDDAAVTEPAAQPQDKTSAGNVASKPTAVGGKYKFVMRSRNDAVLTAMKKTKLNIGGAK